MKMIVFRKIITTLLLCLMAIYPMAGTSAGQTRGAAHALSTEVLAELSVSQDLPSQRYGGVHGGRGVLNSPPPASRTPPRQGGEFCTRLNCPLLIDKNPFSYSRYYQDRESGFYYCNSRYYSSRIARFTSRDTYDLDNRYACCNANPIMYADPNGHARIPLSVLQAIADFAGDTTPLKRGLICSASETIFEKSSYSSLSMRIGMRKPLPRRLCPPVLTSEQKQEIIDLYDKGEHAEGGVHQTKKVSCYGFTYYLKKYVPYKGYGYQAAKLWNERYKIIQPEFAVAFAGTTPDGKRGFSVLPHVGEPVTSMKSQKDIVSLCRRIQEEYMKTFGECHPDLHDRERSNLSNLTIGPGDVINPIDLAPEY